MKRFFPVLVAGFVGGVISIIPFLKSAACCLFIPMVSVFALFLEMKSTNQTKPFKLERGIFIGFLTGFFASLWGFSLETIITFITHTNELVQSSVSMDEVFKGLPFDEASKKQAMVLMNEIVNQIREYGFSPMYSGAIFLSGFLSNTIFGVIGGMVGVKILNNKFLNEE